MNKTFTMITGIMCAIATMFITYSVMHMSKVNSKIDEWEETYDVIYKDVSTFTKISDPKTIQLYVKELNKILDEIHFLGRMVESGQLADEGLTKILNEQVKMNKKILKMVTLKAHNKTRDEIEDLSDRTVGALDQTYEDMMDIDDKLDKTNKKMHQQLDDIQDEVNEIKKLLKTMNKKKFMHTHKD
jgi:methyl-accepting chemotaxis protein